jgi:hypothetical protein
MTAVGRTLRVHGIYLVVVALPFLIVPSVVLSLLPLPEANDAWIRVLGLVVLVLGVYYIAASSDDAPTFAKATVIGRLFAAAGLVVIAVTSGYLFIALFAGPDAAGAVWTWTARRRAAADQPAPEPSPGIASG